MGYKGDQARSREAWHINLSRGGWLYAPLEEEALGAFKDRWAALFAKEGMAERFVLMMTRGDSGRAFDLLRRPKYVNLKTHVAEVGSPPLHTPMTLDIVETTYEIGWHIIGGRGVTLGDLAPGEDNTLALIQSKQHIGIFWPHGRQDEAVVVQA